METREGLLGPGPCWGVEWARAGPTIPSILLRAQRHLGGPGEPQPPAWEDLVRGNAARNMAAEASWRSCYPSGVFQDE